MELTVQNRIDDRWYAGVMEECRGGQVTDGSYKYLVGLPTDRTGSWRVAARWNAERRVRSRPLGKLKRMADEKPKWTAMQDLECEFCQKERAVQSRDGGGGPSRPQ